MRYDGIGGVKRMKIRLYPPEMDDDVIAPKAGSILAGYDPRVNFGVEVGFGSRLPEMDEAVLYGPTIARPDPTETCLIEAVFDEMMARALQGPGGGTVRPSPQQMAGMLARQGRGSDTEVAHVARGEIVLPKALQNPEVMAAIRKAAATYKVPVEMLSVGNAMNRINPKTGAPEFDPSWLDRMKGWFGFGDDTSPANMAQGQTMDYRPERDGPPIENDMVYRPDRDAPGITDDLVYRPPLGQPGFTDVPLVDGYTDVAAHSNAAGPSDLPSINDALRKAQAGQPSPELRTDFSQARKSLGQQANRGVYQTYLQDPRVSAALDTVQGTEGGKMGIRTGGGTYPPSRDHPGPNSDGSSAAGPYQITQGTWGIAQGIVGPLDFSNPEDQKIATVALWDRKNRNDKNNPPSALEALTQDNIDGFLSGASKTWQSLPEGPGALDKSHFPIPTYYVTGPGGLSYDASTGQFQPNFQIEEKDRNPAWSYNRVMDLYQKNLRRYQ